MFSPRLARSALAERHAGGRGHSSRRFGLAAGVLWGCLQLAAAETRPIPDGRWGSAPVPPVPVREILAADPGNAMAWRLAADFLEAAGDAQAVEVRREVVVSDPDAEDDRLALIHTALRFGDLPTAQQVLEELSSSAPASAGRREAACAVALASGYEDPFVPLATDDAAEKERRSLADAVVDLRHGSSPVAAAARKKLRARTLAFPAENRAWQELVRDALRGGNVAAALSLSESAAGRPSAPFDDQITLANVKLLGPAANFPAICETLATQAAASPASAALLAEWLIARGRAGAARDWLETLPDRERETAEVRAARADAFAALQDWAPALALVSTGAWGPVPPDLVARARSAQSLGPGEARRLAWDDVLQRAHGDSGALRVLHRLARSCKLAPECQAALFALARADPKQSGAFQALADEFRRDKNTAKLQSLYALWHAAAPEDVVVASNLLLLEALTTKKPSNELRSTIERLVMYHPEEPRLEIVHALTLWQLGRAPEALAVTESLRSSDRHRASLALYHGLFAAVTGGRADEVLLYLKLSEKATLLPEEQALVETARAALAKPPAR